MRGREWLEHVYSGIVGGETRWMGARAQKNPLDAWVYQEIIHDTRPEAIVELGNAFGGGTLFLAHMLDLIGNGIVVAVDHNHSSFEADHERITKVTGKTTEVVDQVREMVEGKRTMVIHDADHRAPAVLADLRLYAPLVSPGCYLVVEDGAGDVMGRKDPGPLQAIDAFLAESPDFERDESRERFAFTYNPGGFLRRRG